MPYIPMVHIYDTPPSDEEIMEFARSADFNKKITVDGEEKFSLLAVAVTVGPDGIVKRWCPTRPTDHLAETGKYSPPIG